MKQNKKSLVIGVTGGIGSGKSTVSSFLEKLGVPVIDADDISRNLLKPGGKALAEVVAAFGSELIDSNGQLDRKALGEIVFSDSNKLKVLNAIVHKYVAEEIDNRIKCYKTEGFSRIVVDAPLPIEHGFLDLCDIVWTVHADEEIRIKRIMKRSGMTREEAIARINSQITERQYIEIATTVIYNNETEEHLKRAVELQFNKLIG